MISAVTRVVTIRLSIAAVLACVVCSSANALECRQTQMHLGIVLPASWPTNQIRDEMIRGCNIATAGLTPPITTYCILDQLDNGAASCPDRFPDETSCKYWTGECGSRKGSLAPYR